MREYSSLIWLVLAILTGALIELVDAGSIVSLSSLSNAQGLPLPQRVRLEGEISNVRRSSSSLVFDVSNRGTLTCYYRNPPPPLLVFANDVYFIDATLVQTVQGRLCVVKSMRPASFQLQETPGSFS